MRKPEFCGRCGEEVRYGVRDGVTGFWHRENVDHTVIHGKPWSEEDSARLEAEATKPRFRVSAAAAKRCPTYQALWPLEEYTTREVDILKDPDAARRARRLAIYRGEDPDYVEPIPEPEIRRHDVEVESFPPRSGIRQIVNTVLKADGWELRRLTHARGAYVGSAGTVLSISDTIVMGARGPEVDGSTGGRRILVASWRDNSFDFAYAGILAGRHVNTLPLNSAKVKAWIRGEDV